MNLDAIPAELRERPQWLLWRCEMRDDEDKPTKVPYRADRLGRASSTEPETWASFEEAQATASKDGFDGIGFVFAPEDPFVGIDLDDARNSTGLRSDAAALVLKLDSYTEWSPSGQGVHVLLRGHLPGTRRRIGKVEMYEQGRFFTFTGDHVAAQWATRMRDEYAALDKSYRKYPLGQLVGRYMRAISFEGKAENTRLSYSPSCACSCSSSATWRRSSLWAWISCTSS